MSNMRKEKLLTCKIKDLNIPEKYQLTSKLDEADVSFKIRYKKFKEFKNINLIIKDNDSGLFSSVKEKRKHEVRFAAIDCVERTKPRAYNWDLEKKLKKLVKDKNYKLDILSLGQGKWGRELGIVKGIHKDDKRKDFILNNLILRERTCKRYVEDIKGGGGKPS